MPEVVLSRTLMTLSTYPAKLHFCRDQYDDVGHNVLGCRAAILGTANVVNMVLNVYMNNKAY